MRNYALRAPAARAAVDGRRGVDCGAADGPTGSTSTACSAAAPAAASGLGAGAAEGVVTVRQRSCACRDRAEGAVREVVRMLGLGRWLGARARREDLRHEGGCALCTLRCCAPYGVPARTVGARARAAQYAEAQAARCMCTPAHPRCAERALTGQTEHAGALRCANRCPHGRPDMMRAPCSHGPSDGRAACGVRWLLAVSITAQLRDAVKLRGGGALVRCFAFENRSGSPSCAQKPAEGSLDRAYSAPGREP